jgi:uncharacterized protein (TIGR02246 family)
MRKTTMSAVAVAALGIGLTMAFGQRPVAATGDEESIRKTIETYVAAYNKGDLDAVMSNWADGAEFVNEDGVAARGKEAVANLFRKGLAEQKGKTMRGKVASIRLLRKDLAIVDGTSEIANADGTSDKGPFTSVWAKTGDKWQIISLRDLPSGDDAEANGSAAGLRSLDWLVGEWVYQDKDTVVTISCKKSHKESFLRLEQVVRVKGEETLSLTQVIGWDPHRQQLRSWVFDSAGGFGNGLWDRDGNKWIVDVDGVRADGRVASGINMWRFVDANSFEWAATDRQIDGEPAPDLHVKYTRQSIKK